MAINNSIVDYLNSIGQDSSYAARKKLAAQNGIQGYSGTASQNMNLLKTLQNSQNTQPNNSGVVTPETKTDSGVPSNVTAGVTSTMGSNTQGGNFQKSQSTQNYQNQLKALEGNRPAAYQPSDAVNDYSARLRDQEANKPGAYQSEYEAEIDSILNSILGNKSFSYTADDLANDDLYQMYRDSYTRQGDLAMRDTMGNAAALTGGYGSTYASAAGQQAYDNYLAKLNDLALEFSDREYEKYLNEQAERYNQLSAVTGLDDTAYGRYRDEVGDYYNDRSYLASRYDQEYAKDYGKYRDGVNDYNTDRSYLAGMYDTEYGHDMSEYQADLQQKQWAEEFAFQQAQAAQDQANWEAEMALARAKAASGGSGSGKKTTMTEDGGVERSPAYDDVLSKLTAWMNNGELNDHELYNQLMAYGDEGKITEREAYYIAQKVGIDLEAAARQEALLSITQESEENDKENEKRKLNGAFR